MGKVFELLLKMAAELAAASDYKVGLLGPDTSQNLVLSLYHRWHTYDKGRYRTDDQAFLRL